MYHFSTVTSDETILQLKTLFQIKSSPHPEEGLACQKSFFFLFKN